MDEQEFVAYVGQQLADYADGEGDMAHDVLDRIQRAYLRHWEMPEAE